MEDHTHHFHVAVVVAVQSLNCLQLFVTPLHAAQRVSLPLTISWCFPKFMSIKSVMPSNHLILCLPLLHLPSIFSIIRVFSMSWLCTPRGQCIVASVSASVPSMSIQGWFGLGLTGWISMQSKGLWRIFPSTTVQKHQFFSTQLSLWSNSHTCTWLLERAWLWPYGSLFIKSGFVF